MRAFPAAAIGLLLLSGCGTITPADPGDTGISGGPDAATTGPKSMLFVTLQTGVAVFQVDTETGDLTARTTVATAGVTPLCLVSHRNRFLYGTDNAESGTAFGFQIQQATGDLIALEPFTVSLGDQPVFVMNTAANRLYVPNVASGSISGFNIDDRKGTLTEFSGSPFTIGAGSSPQFTVAHPSGKYLYVGLAGDAAGVVPLAIRADGSLTALAAAAVAGNPRSAAIHPGGKFLYVTDTDGAIFQFAIDESTGTLTALDPPSLPLDPAGGIGTAIHPGGDAVYVSHGNAISAFGVNPVAGGLTKLDTLTLTGGDPSGLVTPNGLAVEATGRFLYSANFHAQSIGRFSIDSAGRLSASSPVPVTGSALTWVYAITTDG